MTDTPTEIITPADEPVIHTRRFFKAPTELVYRALTEPEYLRRWFGPRVLEITVCEADLRVGGSWRVVHRAPDGTEFRFHGEFLELDPPHKRVGTFVYE
ncbi:MAG TPA: SRPBCC domain-containing protein, partial [Acidimicrobiales bacterium]|nr:SRPBCC domain-containing protein [Acidimicrobiales bacterium]